MHCRDRTWSRLYTLNKKRCKKYRYCNQNNSFIRIYFNRGRIVSSIFILEDVGRDNMSVKILETKKSDLDGIQELVVYNKNLIFNKVIEFYGSYNPCIDESFKLCNFVLPSEINEAINNPLAVEKIDFQQGDNLNLRALFLPTNDDSRETRIIFQ